jgi:hypothetical protein
VDVDTGRHRCVDLRKDDLTQSMLKINPSQDRLDGATLDEFRFLPGSKWHQRGGAPTLGNVCCWHLADMPAHAPQVRFLPQIGHYGTTVRNRNTAKITRCTMP